jgi:hypothetical protein
MGKRVRNVGNTKLDTFMSLLYANLIILKRFLTLYSFFELKEVEKGLNYTRKY